MIKYLNNLIKLLKKNLLISLFLIFLLIFGFFQLSIGNFTSSDFTMTNTDLVGSNIQLSTLKVNHTDLSFNANSAALLTLAPVNPTWPPSSQAYAGSASSFCSAYGQSFISALGYGYVIKTYSIINGQWTWSDSNSNVPSSILCQSTDLNTLGSIVQTIPTTTISSYDTLSLKYNYTLNGGTLTPVLIVNGVEKSLINNVLTGSFPIGTNVSVKFSFTGSTSSTPQINNNLITLVGSNTTSTLSNQNSLSTSINTQIISTLKTTSQSLSSPKTSVNKIASYFGDLVFNFFKLLLSPFGF